MMKMRQWSERRRGEEGKERRGRGEEQKTPLLPPLVRLASIAQGRWVREKVREEELTRKE